MLHDRRQIQFMINKHVNKSSGIEIIAFYTSHFSCSYHAAWHAHEHILNINHAACLSFFLSCNIKRWYLINFPINYENRIYFLPISILSCRFFTCYGGFLSSGLGASMPTLVGRSVGRSVGLSVCLSLEKMSKIVKNQEFRLHLKTKVVDLLE